jgi:Nuclease A inhibitor-like protein.
MSKKPSLADRLAKAVEGLVLPSERDEPFTVVEFPGAELPSDVRGFRKLVGVDAKTPVGDFHPAEMLAALGKGQPSDGAGVTKMRTKFRKVADLLDAEFVALRGFKVGKLNVETYILGATADGVIGLKAGGVET